MFPVLIPNELSGVGKNFNWQMTEVHMVLEAQ